MKRRVTPVVQVGKMLLGGTYPVVLQSMTNTDTADVKATALQILELAQAGAEIVRMTVNNEEAAQAVPFIVEWVRKTSVVPVVGDFHFNGNRLLRKYPDCAQALDKYRINPGNADDYNFQEMVEMALRYDKPVRIGVNSGSLDQRILERVLEVSDETGDETFRTSDEIMELAAVQSVLHSAAEAEKLGLAKDKIVLSAKMSEVGSLVRVYKALSSLSDYVLHLGLTEAGMGDPGVVSSSIALGTLLQEGIGDTIRVSLTPVPGAARTKEVMVGQQILQSVGLKNFRPKVISCPGCGRTGSDYFQQLAQKVNAYIDERLEDWKRRFPGVVDLKIAVMGCVVNGPGESRQADIGIALPGKMEQPVAPVFVEGKLFCELRGEDLGGQFLGVLEGVVRERTENREQRTENREQRTENS